ncbi:MAG: sensor histidine kinase [Candidatus Sericytochromatia bacterium]
MTLARRLIIGFGFLALLLLTVPSLIIGAALQQYFRGQATREILDISTYLQRRVVTLSTQEPYQSLGDSAFMALLERSLTDYLVLGEGLQLESTFFVQLRELKTGRMITTPNLEGGTIPVLRKGMPYAGEMNIRSYGRIPVLFHRTILQRQNRPFVEMQVAVSLVEYASIFRQLLIFWLISSFLALALTVLIAWLLGRQILKPLISLTQEIEGMVQSDKLGELETSALPPDQILRLAQTFNTLLRRLSELLEKQQRFVSDASHELRSPLTAIQGHAELLLKRGQSNPEILTEGLEIIRRESDRLGKLVEELLLLAQLRHRKPQAERMSLARVARQVVESRQLLHENLHFESHQAAWMQGDQDAIRRILINLIDNALRFTSPDALIEVRVLEKDGRCWLLVKDSGAGIAAVHLPHIFERFYRQEADRNRSKGGAGLGLPIVKELVEWHQGSIEVQSRENEGTQFTLSFPAVQRELN